MDHETFEPTPEPVEGSDLMPKKKKTPKSTRNRKEKGEKHQSPSRAMPNSDHRTEVCRDSGRPAEEDAEEGCS